MKRTANILREAAGMLPIEQNEAAGKTKKQKDYLVYFNKKLKEHGIDSPNDLKTDEAKQKFFKLIDDGWSAMHEGDKGEKK